MATARLIPSCNVTLGMALTCDTPVCKYGKNFVANAWYFPCLACAPEAMRGIPVVIIDCCQSCNETAAVLVAHFCADACTRASQVWTCRAAAWPGAVCTLFTPSVMACVEFDRLF